MRTNRRLKPSHCCWCRQCPRCWKRMPFPGRPTCRCSSRSVKCRKHRPHPPSPPNSETPKAGRRDSGFHKKRRSGNRQQPLLLRRRRLSRPCPLIDRPEPSGCRTLFHRKPTHLRRPFGRHPRRGIFPVERPIGRIRPGEPLCRWPSPNTDGTRPSPIRPEPAGEDTREP